MRTVICILAALLLVSAGLNVWLGYKRGQAESDANLWCLIALQADTENKRLSKALNNRQVMETFMETQTDAYFAVLDAFNTIAPDMPQGNMPADRDLQGLYVLYYKKMGMAWDSDAEKLRRWGQEQKEISDTIIPDNPEGPVRMPAVSFE